MKKNVNNNDSLHTIFIYKWKPLFISTVTLVHSYRNCFAGSLRFIFKLNILRFPL